LSILRGTKWKVKKLFSGFLHACHVFVEFQTNSVCYNSKTVIADINQDRQYNIYKKFDSINTISKETINRSKIIKNYSDLDNKIETKPFVVSKVKI